MRTDEMKWLLKDKIVTDFRGYPIGRVKKLWYDTTEGPLVVVERSTSSHDNKRWEAIPMQSIHTVSDEIRLKPPIFAE
jgi:sporulation protein YlmC with PRC-barrel domain